MKFGSLFTGIGGLDLGLEHAGMECAWQVENDPYANKVLEKHWPNIHREKDVKEVGKHNLEPVDLICGGFPCQPHSVAGKRRGAEDDRNLWPEYFRIITELKPKYVLAENVPGIITTMHDEVLSQMEAEGYDCWTFAIPAVAFDAPHRRERIFIVAWNSNIRNGDEGQVESVAKGENSESTGICESLPNPPLTNDGRSTPEQVQRSTQQSGIGAVEGDVADTPKQGLEGQITEGKLPEGEQGRPTECSFWTTEPDVGRVADGVPKRVDRLRCLGNAVVPQVAEYIGKKIIEFDKIT